MSSCPSASTGGTGEAVGVTVVEGVEEIVALGNAVGRQENSKIVKGLVFVMVVVGVGGYMWRHKCTRQWVK